MAKDVNELLAQIAAGGEGFEAIAKQRQAQTMRDSLTNLGTEYSAGRLDDKQFLGNMLGIDPTITKTLAENILARQNAASKLKPMLSGDQVDTQYGGVLKPEYIKAIKSAPDREEQDRLASFYKDVIKNDAINANQKTSQVRLGDQYTRETETKFYDRLNQGLDKEVGEYQRQNLVGSIQGFNDMVSQGLAAIDIVKGIGKDAQVSNEDLQRYLPPTAGKTIQELRNYFNNTNLATADEGTKESFRKIIAVTEEKYYKNLQDKISGRLNQLLNTESYGKVMMSEGQISPAVESVIDKFDLTVKKNAKGHIVVNPRGRTDKLKQTEDPANRKLQDFDYEGDYAGVANIASQLSDENPDKAKALNQIKKWQTGKAPLPQDYENILRKLVEQEKAGK